MNDFWEGKRTATVVPVPYYTTDLAAADQVRQRAAGMSYMKFCQWVRLVEDLAFNRADPNEVLSKWLGSRGVLRWGQPSDYVGAFWLLDCDEELREMGRWPDEEIER